MFILGLEGLGVFVFLVLGFVFCVVFVSVLFLFCCWIVFGVGSCFAFFFLFFCVLVFFCFLFFCFLEGLRVRRGGPKGHLTWPPKPSLFLFVLFVFLGRV